jgi:hypothetical protein
MGWHSRARVVPTPDPGVQAMSSTAINERPERILSSHVRRHLRVLPEDPTDEELARHWTLSEADPREVRRCRGEDNRRRVALQLGALRT